MISNRVHVSIFSHMDISGSVCSSHLRSMASILLQPSIFSPSISGLENSNQLCPSTYKSGFSLVVSLLLGSISDSNIFAPIESSEEVLLPRVSWTH